MLSTDIGSLPSRVEEDIIRMGAREIHSMIYFLMESSDSQAIFESEVIGAFADKLRVGLEVPNYPQFRDMNEMFFQLIRGFEYTSEGILRVGSLSSKPGATIPEVSVLRSNLSNIMDEVGRQEIVIKACVTGPYTLASFFKHKSPTLFEELGSSLAEIVSNTIFKSKRGGVIHLSIDEPVFGFMNDPTLDYGSDGREALRRSWEDICRSASIKGVETSVHLHDTSNDLFWEVDHLDMVESHVGDPLYEQETTERRLEETDKMLKASIAVTQFDNLIAARLKERGFKGNIPEKIGDTWTMIRRGDIDPLRFIDSLETMRKRLEKIVLRYGGERVPYASPECGLSSFPDYNTAIECLKRVATTVGGFYR